MTRKTKKQEIEWLKKQDKLCTKIAILMLVAIVFLGIWNINQGTRIIQLDDTITKLFGDGRVFAITEYLDDIKIFDAKWVCTSNKTVQKTVDVEDEWCFDKFCLESDNLFWTMEKYDEEINYSEWRGIFRKNHGMRMCIEEDYFKYQDCLAQDTDNDGFALVEETECDEWMLVKK